MTEATGAVIAVNEVERSQHLQPIKPVRVPQYQRNLFPKNIVLSAEHLQEFFELLTQANERAKVIEFNNLNITQFESASQAKERVNEFVQLEYEYIAANGDSVQGLGNPNTDEHAFPDDLKSFFISNAAYAKRAINVRPLNTVEVFLGFEKPSLKIDLQTLPSNPTENRSVINVGGRDEDWVISTAERIQLFFDRRKAFRPLIHGSGTYDYFTYLAFLPALLWLFRRMGSQTTAWLESQPMFLNVIFGIYAILLSLLVARFVFQYVRWLFPPMEYYKHSRWGAYIHRSVAGIIGSTLILSAVYDIVKTVFLSFFS